MAIWEGKERVVYILERRSNKSTRSIRSCGTKGMQSYSHCFHYFQPCWPVILWHKVQLGTHRRRAKDYPLKKMCSYSFQTFWLCRTRKAAWSSHLRVDQQVAIYEKLKREKWLFYSRNFLDLSTSKERKRILWSENKRNSTYKKLLLALFLSE